jgi:predicted amidohydrolase YtcJ
MRQTCIVAMLAVFSLSALAQTGPADTMLITGRVITGDARDFIVEAHAIKGGKVLAFGARAAIEKLSGPATKTIDLKGRTATPGLIDSHIHFQQVDALCSVDLSEAYSIEACLAKIREGVAKAKRGEWVRGRGWDEGKFAEHRYLFAADLDKMAPDNPVWMMHTTGHYGVANSAALKLAHM